MIKYKNWRENNMTDLQECRRKIDEIDNQMVELFEKRMKVCEEVAEYKIHTGKKVLDPEREHAKLEEIRKKAHGEFNELGAQELFQQIMAISRKRQYQLLTEYGPKEKEDFQMVEQLPRNNVTVVFQGVEGAYSYGAMRAFFSRQRFSSDRFRCSRRRKNRQYKGFPGCHGRSCSRKSRLRSPSY